MQKPDLTDDERDDIKRMIILNEPVQYQQIWLNEPVTAVHTIENVIKTVKQNSDLSSDEKEALTNQIISYPTIEPVYQRVGSEERNYERSYSESQRFEDSSDEQETSTHLNKYEDHANRGIFFVKSSVSSFESQQLSSSSEDQNQLPKQN